MTVSAVGYHTDRTDQASPERNTRRRLAIGVGTEAVLEYEHDDENAAVDATADDTGRHIRSRMLHVHLDAVRDRVRDGERQLTQAQRPDAAATMSPFRRKLAATRRIAARAVNLVASVDGDRPQRRHDDAERLRAYAGEAFHSQELFEEADDHRRDDRESRIYIVFSDAEKIPETAENDGDDDVRDDDERDAVAESYVDQRLQDEMVFDVFLCE